MLLVDITGITEQNKQCRHRHRYTEERSANRRPNIQDPGTEKENRRGRNERRHRGARGRLGSSKSAWFDKRIHWHPLLLLAEKMNCFPGEHWGWWRTSHKQKPFSKLPSFGGKSRKKNHGDLESFGAAFQNNDVSHCGKTAPTLDVMKRRETNSQGWD